MLNSIQLAVLLCGAVLWGLAPLVAGQSCTSCGPECVPACGSRRYRTCCFNYLRKRRSSSGQAPGMPADQRVALLDEQLSQLGPLEQLELVIMPGHFVPKPDADAASYQEVPGPHVAPIRRGSGTLLHRLLDADPSDQRPSSPAASQHQPGPDQAVEQPADRDWIADIRRRVNMEYTS